MMRYMLHQPASLQSVAFSNVGQWLLLLAKDTELKRTQAQNTENVTEQTQARTSTEKEHVELEENMGSPSRKRVKLSSEQHEPMNCDSDQIYIEARTLAPSVTISDYLHHISDLSSELHTKLLTEIILAIDEIKRKKRISESMDRVFRLFPTILLTSSLTCLRLTLPVLMDACFPALCAKAPALTTLTHLELRLALLPDRIKSNSLQADVIRILEHLHGLKHLSLTSYCTYDILKCIVVNCPQLEELNISQAGARINDDNVRLLTALPNLRRVHLSGTSVGPRGVEELLFGCEHLEHIDISGLIPHILACCFMSGNKYLGKVFNLKTCDTGAPLAQLKMLAEICPHIQQMSVQKCERDAECNLGALAGFKNIRELKLAGYSFYDDGVADTLQPVGHQLQHLHLQKIHQLDLNAVKIIMQLCPQLKNLTIAECVFREHSACEVQVIPLFREIKRLTLGMQNVIPEPSAIMFLLSNCFNVEILHLTFSPLDVFTDELILNVLDSNPMACLQQLIVWQSALKHQVITERVLDRIIQNGISRPVVTLAKF